MNASSEHIAMMIQLLAGGREPDPPPVPAQIANAMSALLASRARELHQADPDHALKANPLHPGYLSRHIDQTEVHVPFPLAEHFPTANTLRILIQLANELSLDPAACICVSGSGAWLGRFHQTGDLDYCEYVFSGERLPLAVLRQSEKPRALASLAEVKAPGLRDQFPWGQLARGLAAFVAAGLPAPGADARRLKLDYCAVPPALGPMPASNVVIWLDPDVPESGNALASFAHQEAVIDRGGGVARSLINGERLRAYLGFLFQDIDNHLKDKPFKALKRTLSLCATLGLSDRYDAMIRLLNDELSMRVTLRKRLQEFETLVPLTNPADHQRLCDAATEHRATQNDDGLDDDDLREIEDAVRESVAEARQHIEGLMKALGE